MKKSELGRVADILANSLQADTARFKWWMKLLGTDSFSTIKNETGVVGAGGIIRFGHWFGGRSVPCGGITAVGVSPECRGMGAASALMKRLLCDLHDEGIPISSLYPATVNLYRIFGYERAGSRIEYRIAMNHIDTVDRSLEIVRAGDSDHSEIQKTYEEFARRNSGMLDRTVPMWKRKFAPYKIKVHKFLVKCGGETAGYVMYATGEMHQPISIVDWVALTPAAARRILTFLSDHRSIPEGVLWIGPPNEPMLYHISDQKHKIEKSFDWMLRIVDVKSALEMRGYPAGLETEVHFGIKDDLLPWNSGRFTLEISGGRGRVRKGGRGILKTTPRGIAPLYSGHLSPVELRTLGLISGENLDSATLAFSGPKPWLMDMF